jgi:hypothetical protein
MLTRKYNGRTFETKETYHELNVAEGLIWKSGKTYNVFHKFTNKHYKILGSHVAADADSSLLGYDSMLAGKHTTQT